MSGAAMPPYPSTIPASAFSPTAKRRQRLDGHARGRCAPGDRLDLRHGRPPGLAATSAVDCSCASMTRAIEPDANRRK